MKRCRRRVRAAALAMYVVAASIATTATVGAQEAGAPPGSDDAVAVEQGALASFQGRTINLARSWEGAQACLVLAEGTECFATEAELKAHMADDEGAKGANGLEAAGSGGVAAAGSGCGSYLALYDYSYFGGQSLWLATRWSWLNLSVYGFSNRTSSYKIGSCAAYFADYNSGGGSWYPTYLTQAGSTGAAMVTGWNNRVSSVYIT